MNLFRPILIIVTTLAAFPAWVFAQGPPVSPSCSYILSGEISNIQNFISTIGCGIGRAVGVVIPLAMLFFLWGLMKFMLSAGNEDAKENGKRIMFWGIIALFVMVSVWGIVNILQSNLGIANISF